MIDATLSFIISLLYKLTLPSYLLAIFTLLVLVQPLMSKRPPYKSIVLVVSLWLAVGIAPIGQWMLAPLEYRYAPPQTLDNVKGIIVLGGGQRLSKLQQRPYSGLGQHSARIIAGFSLSRQYNLPLYFIGGEKTIKDSTYQESSAIVQLHKQLAIMAPLFIDDSSKNTFDNALVAKKMLADSSDGNYLLVTSAAHMPRAMVTFSRAGLTPQPYPVNYMSHQTPYWFDNASLTSKLYLIDYATHEWLGLVQYFLLGRSNELFPKKH